MKRLWPALVLSTFASLFVPLSAWSQQLTCESRNYQQEFCPTGVNIARAWLLVQRSQSPCIQGQTWGYQSNGIWVNQGCEADFGFQGMGSPPAGGGPGQPGATRISCDSHNYRQQYCAAGQSITSAWLIEQRSSAPCIQGQTWGYQNSDIWVTNGCAGDFGVQGYGGRPPSAPQILPIAGNIVCESRNYQQQFCSTGRPIGRAWLVTQRSRSACVQGQSWGYDANGIWVTEGCEGEFGFQ